MNLLNGVRCFFQGLQLATSAEYRRFVIAPAGVSLVIIVVGLGFGFSYVSDLSNYLISSLPSWLSFLEWILAPLLYLMGILVGAWSFGLLATIIGSPFLGELSSQIEGVVSDDTPWWQQIGPSLMRELRKLRYHLPRLLLLLIFSIIPVLNTFAPLLWLGFGAWMMAAQFCDYSSENRQQQFSATLAEMSQHRSAALGFGACATIAMSIPIFNIIVPPAAVAGGTLLMQSMRGLPHDTTPS